MAGWALDVCKKGFKSACVILVAIFVVSIILFLIAYFFQNPLKEYFNSGKHFLISDNC